MNKKTFLKKLEEKLNILEESERQDIINEYKDIIEEKVKNGKTESEAINDFGDINELVHEILKAYKINPNFDKKNNKKEEVRFWDGLEAGIRTVAHKLAHFTNEIVEGIKNNNNNLTMEKVFEIIIKFFILMFVLILLKFPFYLLYNMGVVIFDFGHNPVSTILLLGWKMLLWFIYFIICLVLIYVFFQTQLKSIDDEKNVKNNSRKKDFEKKENQEEKKKIK